MHIAYLAGLLDGEGHIYMRPQGRNRSRAPQISIGMTDSAPIEALKYFGGYVRESSRPGRQTMHIWYLNGSSALELLRDALPHLVIERRRALASMLVNDQVVNNLQAKGETGSKVGHNERLFRAMQAQNAARLLSLPKPRPTRPQDADYAYLAGILDGEGYVSFDQRRIEVWSTDPELCQWLADRFGGKAYKGTAASGNQRTTWRWLRSPTGCEWAARVADLMQLTRKASELRRMQGFERTPAPPTDWPASLEYQQLRMAGVLRAPAMREAGISLAHARFLDENGTLPRGS